MSNTNSDYWHPVPTKNIRQVYNNLNSVQDTKNENSHHHQNYQQPNQRNQNHNQHQQHWNGGQEASSEKDPNNSSSGGSSYLSSSGRLTSCIPPLGPILPFWCVPAAHFDNFNALNNELVVENDSYNQENTLNGFMGQLSTESPPMVNNTSSSVMQNGGLVEYVPLSSVANDLSESHNEASACLPSDLPLANDNNANHANVANSYLKSPDYYESSANGDLKMCLKNQLEYYFSRENLAVDAYLKSQMDNDQFVPIRIVANFNKVRKLTTDINLIISVLRESPHVQVDEKGEKVRPICKRCTLVLREIPPGTEKHEIEQMFIGEKCPKVVSCEYAHNNSWYVNFDTDEDAQRAFMHLRQMATFKGKPILARIKNAPMPRLPSVVSNGYCAVPSTLVPLHSPQLTYANGPVPLPAGTAATTPATANGPGCGIATPAAAVAATAPSSVPPSSTVLPSPAQPPSSAADSQHHQTQHPQSQQHQTSQQSSKLAPPHNPPMDPIGAAHSVAGLSTSLTTMPNVFFYAATSPRTVAAGFSAATGGFSAATAAVPPPAVVAPQTAAAVLSAAPTAWTSAPGVVPFFDLGHILAVNGLQAHSTFRPSIQGIQVIVPAPAQLARPVGANFAERVRNKRNGSLGSYYPTHPGYRSSSSSMESRRPAINSNNNRQYSNGLGGAGGALNGGLGSSLNGGHAAAWNDNSIRHLPNNRSSFSGAYPGFGYNGPTRNNYNNNHINYNNNNNHHTSGNTNGRGYRDRSSMSSSDYWSSKDFNSAKNNRKQKVSANAPNSAPVAAAANTSTNTTTTNNNTSSSSNAAPTVSSTATEDKKANNFDFQPSSFPPLAETDVPQQNAKMSYAEMAKHAVVNNSATTVAATTAAAAVSTVSEGSAAGKH